MRELGSELYFLTFHSSTNDVLRLMSGAFGEVSVPQ